MSSTAARSVAATRPRAASTACAAASSPAAASRAAVRSATAAAGLRTGVLGGLPGRVDLGVGRGQLRTGRRDRGGDARGLARLLLQRGQLAHQALGRLRLHLELHVVELGVPERFKVEQRELLRGGRRAGGEGRPGGLPAAQRSARHELHDGRVHPRQRRHGSRPGRLERFEPAFQPRGPSRRREPRPPLPVVASTPSEAFGRRGELTVASLQLGGPLRRAVLRRGVPGPFLRGDAARASLLQRGRDLGAQPGHLGGGVRVTGLVPHGVRAGGRLGTGRPDPRGQRRLLGSRPQPPGHGAGGVDPGAQGGGGLAQPLLHGREPVGAEEPLEQGAARLGVGAQEGGEVTLGEEHQLGELLEAQPQDVVEDQRRLVDAGGHRHPVAPAQLPDEHPGLLRRGARAAPLRALPRGRPRHLEPPPAGGELAHHLGCDPLTRVVAAQPAALARARDGAVEREAHRVEDARLARPGRPVQQEQPVRRQGVEVDLGGTRERTERGDPQPVDPHPAASSSASSGDDSPAAGTCTGEAAGTNRRPARSGATPLSRARPTRAPSIAARSTAVSSSRGARRRTCSRKPQQSPRSSCSATRRVYVPAADPPAGSNRSSRACGKRERTRVIASAGRSSSVRVTWHHAASACARSGRDSRSSRRPRSTASGRGTGASTASMRSRPPRPNSTSQEPLTCACSLKEYASGDPEYRTPSRELLAAVQVPERHVVGPREDLGGHRPDAPDADVPLAVARLATDDERVRGHHRTGAARPGRPVGPHRRHGGCQGLLVPRPRRAPQRWPRERGLEVGQRVDGDVAPAVGEQDRLTAPRRVGAHMDAGLFQQPRAEPQTARGVVVAAGEDDGGARAGQPGQDLVEQGHDLDAGQGPVVDVTGHDDRVDPLAPDDLDQVVEDRGLRLEQPDPMERAAQVPVGGVEDPHGPDSRKLRRSSVDAAP